jgi:hypothetical protein
MANIVNLEKRQKIIDFVEQDDNFFKKIGSESAFAWEKYLVSDYWKNWREEIKSAKSEEDAELLAHKILKIRSDILWNEGAYKKIGVINEYEGDIKRLTEISEKKFQKMTKDGFYKPKDGFRELSTQEILNDPWFSKEIDKFFGLNGENNVETNVVYTNGKKNDKLTKNLLETLKQQTISKINIIREDETLTSSEKQKRLQENQLRLEELNASLNNINSNSLSTNLTGGAVLALAVIFLISFLFIRKYRKNK